MADTAYPDINEDVNHDVVQPSVDEFDDTVNQARAMYADGSAKRKGLEADIALVSTDKQRLAFIRKYQGKFVKAEEDEAKRARLAELRERTSESAPRLVTDGGLADDGGVSLRILQPHQQDILVAMHHDGATTVYHWEEDELKWLRDEGRSRTLAAEGADAFLIDVANTSQSADVEQTVRKVAKSLRKYQEGDGYKSIESSLYTHFAKWEGRDDLGIRERNTPGGLTTADDDEIDGNDRYLGVAGGIVDKWQDRLVEDETEARNAKVSHTTSVRYRPELGTTEAYHPDIVKLFAHLTRGQLRALIQAFARSILGPPEKEFYILWADTDAGKSTVLDAVAAALGHAKSGGYASPIDEGVFMDSNGGSSHTSNAMVMTKALFGYMNDPAFRKLSTAAIKRWVDGNTETVREMHERQTAARVMTTVFITTNKKPPADWSDAAFVNRVRFVVYPKPAESDIDRGSPGIPPLKERVKMAPQAESMLALLIHTAAWVREFGTPDVKMFADEAKREARESAPGILDWADRNFVQTSKQPPIREGMKGYADVLESVDVYLDAEEYANPEYMETTTKKDGSEERLPFGKSKRQLTSWFRERFGLPAGKTILRGSSSRGWRGIRLTTEAERKAWDEEQEALAMSELESQEDEIPMPFLDGLGLPDDSGPQLPLDPEPTVAPGAPTSSVEASDAPSMLDTPWAMPEAQTEATVATPLTVDEQDMLEAIDDVLAEEVDLSTLDAEQAAQHPSAFESDTHTTNCQVCRKWYVKAMYKQGIGAVCATCYNAQ